MRSAIARLDASPHGSMPSPSVLFPVRALSEVFKGKFMQALHEAQAPVQAQPSKAARTAPAADG